MTRKANRIKARRAEMTKAEAPERLGQAPFNIFGCHDCELLLFETPDVEQVSCPWCHRIIDIHVTYSFVAFAPGVGFTRKGDFASAVILE